MYLINIDVPPMAFAKSYRYCAEYSMSVQRQTLMPQSDYYSHEYPFSHAVELMRNQVEMI